MDYRDYNYSYPPYNDRDRDERRDRYDRSLSHSRDLSPYRSRTPNPPALHHHVPRLSRSADDKYTQRERKDVKRLDSRSTNPAKEYKAKNLLKETEIFNEIFQLPNNFTLEEFNKVIRSTKNFSVKEKYFEDLKTFYTPDQTTYELMITSAINEDQYEKAAVLATEAKKTLNLDEFYSRLIAKYIEHMPPQPMQAFKVLKHAGVEFLGTFLRAAENSRIPIPLFIFNEKLLTICRHRNDVGANIPAARMIWDFVIKHQIPVSKEFYIILADIHTERQDIATARYIFLNTIIQYYPIVRKNDKDLIDIHGLTPRVALLLLREYLSRKNHENFDFVVVTGKGIHNKEGEEFVMRDFLLYNINITKLIPGLTAQIDESNTGRINLSYVRPKDQIP